MTRDAPAIPAAPALPEDDLIFGATLLPNRSLGRGGFLMLMGLVGLVCLIAGVVFLGLGAWPVTGFFGLDIVLLYLAFRLNYRAGRLTETVELTRSALTVRRIEPDGRVRAWDFQPYWLRVEVDDRPGQRNRLTLTSHGRRIYLGSFLSPDERAEFAAALKAALRRCRCLPATV